MAAGLGFKDFTTGEVLTAADVDGYLMQGVWVFASAAARDAAVTSPQEGNFAYLKDTNVTTYYTGSAWANLDTTGMTNPMTTTGDIIYSSPGSTPVRLGIGTAGQVLKVNSGATAPEWATPTSGKVLQVVSATTTTSTAISTGTLTDTTITATITPTLNTSTILVLISANSYVTGSGTNDQAFSSAKLLRGATTIADFTGGVAWQTMALSQATSQTANMVNNQSIVYRDSPASTSALTYKLQAARGSSSTITFQYSSSPSTIVLMEIGA